MPPKVSTKSLNVMKGPLIAHSKEPLTGFYRNGYCDVGPEDTGNHAIAATLTQEFLDFSASKGNNLRSIGLKPGQKWCLCTTRWQEAVKAAKDENDAVVPRVDLRATHESALERVSLGMLRRFAVEGDGKGDGNGSGVGK